MAVLLILVAGAGCSKNETAIKETSQTDLEFLAITRDAAQFGIKIDDEIKITDMMAPTDNPERIRINYFDRDKRISVYDVSNGQVLFDSIFFINTSNVSLSLYQKNSGDPFILVTPPPNAPAPPAGYSKVSMVYTFPNLPDEVKVVVENNKDVGLEYERTDSFLLKKGDFSPYFLGKNGSRKPWLYFYTTGPERKLLGQVDREQFANMNTPYVIYAVRKERAFLNDVYDFYQQKLY